MVRMKRHVVVLLEPAAAPLGIETQCAQILIAPAAAIRMLQLEQQRTQPLRNRTRCLHRMAAFAGTVPGKQRFTRIRKELHVLTRGLLRGADRPAENAGGAHTCEENAVER